MERPPGFRHSRIKADLLLVDVHPTDRNKKFQTLESRRLPRNSCYISALRNISEITNENSKSKTEHVTHLSSRTIFHNLLDVNAKFVLSNTLKTMKKGNSVRIMYLVTRRTCTLWFFFSLQSCLR